MDQATLMQQITLQDIVTVVIGVVVFGVCAVIGQWAWERRHAIAAHYLTRHTIDRLRVLESVNHYQIDADADTDADDDYVEQTARTGRTDGADGRTDGPSVADRWLDRLELDRTRGAVIELMVYSGWSVEQIRAVVKGENASTGEEIKAARARLGMAPVLPAYVTPIAGRPTKATYFETDPALAYQHAPQK